MKKLIFIMMAVLIAGPVYPAQWNKLLPAATDQKIDWPVASQANNDALERTLQGYREGLRLTYSSTSTLVVTAGQVWVSNATGTVRLALSNAASTNVTFTNIDTGAEAASTTYYVYAVAAAADSEAVTFKVSLSATAPSGVTYYKRLGSFYNDASSNITQIYNDNQYLKMGRGTINNGQTIALPAGFAQDHCSWVVGKGYSSATGSYGAGTEQFTANDSRVVTVTVADSEGVVRTGYANYLIICSQ